MSDEAPRFQSAAAALACTPGKPAELEDIRVALRLAELATRRAVEALLEAQRLTAAMVRESRS